MKCKNYEVKTSYSSGIYNPNVSYKSGLTPKMLSEIQNADVLAISNRLAKKGIKSDFKSNKIIAWCCVKSVQIIQQLNKTFGQKLSLPKGIYVEDFRDLNIENPDILGTCNLRLSELRKNSTDAVPSRTLFFNSLHNWDNINSISDNQYAAKHFSTDHFLYAFLHEFSHVIHEDRLLNIFGGKKLAKLLEYIHMPEQLNKYRKDYGSVVKQICDYAENTPLDAVACDMSKDIVATLDKDTLMPTKNPFIDTPYEKISFLHKKAAQQDGSLGKLLQNFWNGNF